jgi:1,6-anhydro-N-acetylmuramate kinase
VTNNLYVGLMSGTSVDAVDCALVQRPGNKSPTSVIPGQMK